jgi:hypothetical protein
MLKSALPGAAIAIAAALTLQALVAAQRVGGAPRFPTKNQFQSSSGAKKHVAAARQIAGTDLLTEFENTCSSTRHCAGRSD